MFAQKQTNFATHEPINPLVNPPLESQVVPANAVSLQDYAARRSYAFDMAEDTFWQGVICAEAYMLFRLLTRLCKDRTFCWPGLEYLATRMQTSVGTIKRRLDVLERAELIERKQRAGGLTSYTYIRPLQQYDDASISKDCPDNNCRPLGKLATPIPNNSVMAHKSGATQPIMTASPTAAHPAEALFFVPKLEISPESPDRSALIPHTIKSQNINTGGGRTTAESLEPDDPPVANQLLEQAGVLSPLVRAELQNRSLAEIKACLGFAQRQRNIADPAGFAVSLIRLGLGQKLSERNRMSRVTDAPTPSIASPQDPSGYTHYHCLHGRVRGSGCPECRTDGATRYNPSHEQQSFPAEQAVNSNLADRLELVPANTWAAVLAELREQLPVSEFDTWLQETQLVGWPDDVAVIGTPNIFVREQVAAVYKQQIGEALEKLVGRKPRVQVVISSA